MARTLAGSTSCTDVDDVVWLQAGEQLWRCGGLGDGTAAGMNEVDSCTVDTARRVLDELELPDRWAGGVRGT